MDHIDVIYAEKADSFRVQYRKDIVYAERDGRELHIQLLAHDLRRPRRPGDRMKEWEKIPPKAYPTIVYMQGSGWGGSDSVGDLPQMAEIAHRGYNVACVEYRGNKDGYLFPTAIADAKAAVRFLRAHSQEYNIDAGRIAAIGDSSGGHTAAMLALTEGDKRFDVGEYLDHSSSVCAVVDLYGPSDICKFRDDLFASHIENVYDPDAINSLLYGSMDVTDEMRRTASPVAYIPSDRELPPFLLMHGDRDDTVSPIQSERFYRALTAAGQRVELVRVFGGSHGRRFWTKPVIDRIVAFLDACV